MNDRVYDSCLNKSALNNIPAVNYKQLCGEYPTSISFALWLASKIIKTGTMPEVLKYHGNIENKYKKILIYNQVQNIHHSLVLLTAC